MYELRDVDVSYLGPPCSWYHWLCLCRSQTRKMALQRCLQFSWRHRKCRSRHQFGSSVAVLATMIYAHDSTVFTGQTRPHRRVLIRW